MLDGGAGNDDLIGGGKDDGLFGGTGNDKLYGDDQTEADLGGQYHGSDYLDGGADDDELIGGGKDDFLIGGAGTDKLWGDADKESDLSGQYHGNDYLDGGDGNDGLIGGGKDDGLFGGTGNDTLYGDDQNETLLTGQYHGNDYLDGGRRRPHSVVEIKWPDKSVGYSHLQLKLYIQTQRRPCTVQKNPRRNTWGSEINRGSHALHLHERMKAMRADWLSSPPRLASSAHRNSPKCSIATRRLKLSLIGGGKDDFLIGGAGTDKLWGDADKESDLSGQYHGNDYLDGGDGNDQLVGGGGNDILVGGAGVDLLWGDGTTLTAQYHGDDILYGEAGDDQLVGGGGNDNLYGGADNDTLLGESGTDLLDGGLGIDYLDGGTGADIMAGGTGDDTYIVDDVGDVVIEAAGDGIDIINSSASITLPDNVEWLNLTGAGDVDVTGNAGANNITGNAGANRLDGGAGNDQLIGGAGADILIGGTGNDYYGIDNAGDTLIEAVGEGDDFVRSTVSYTLAANLERMALDGAANLDGTGNALNNGLWGNLGNNMLAGGIGNDYLFGDAGNDVYVFNRGDGQDSIDNTDLLSATDTLRFGTGITDTDVLGFQVGTDMVLKLKGTNEQAAFINYYGADTVDGSAVSDHKIDRVEFANGVVWDQAMIQTVVDRAANNRAPVVNTALPALQARSGSPFFYTVPNDAILDPDAWDSVAYSVKMPDGSAVPSWLVFDAASRTLSGTPGAGNIGSLQLVLWGFDNYGAGAGQFVTLNVALNQAPVLMSPLLDQVAVQGGAFSFTVAPSAFTDPDAGDTLSFSAALDDGSALPSWLSFNSATQTFSGTPTALGSLRVRVTAKDLGNLSTFDIFDIAVAAPSSVQNGTTGNDVLSVQPGQATTLYGLAGNDTLNGSSANDQLVGGSGNDSLSGGLGNDSYAFELGDGQDILLETGGQDAVVYGAGIAAADIRISRVGSDLLLTHVNGSDQLTLKGWFSYADGRAWVEEIRFADGTVWSAGVLARQALTQTGTDGSDYLNGINNFGDTLLGGGGNDTLSGYGGDDSLEGGVGYDHLFGGDGNDTLAAGADGGYADGGAGDDLYLYGAGDGGLYVSDSGGNDTLRFGAGIRVEDVQFQGQYSDLYINLVDGSQITIGSWFYEYSRIIERFEFADGTVLTADGLNQTLLVQEGTVGNDILTGTGLNDNLIGADGDDTLHGYAGNDLLRGDRGNDRLYGGYGDDSLYGGEGYDQLYGEDGNDYLNGGAGNDYLAGGTGDDSYRELGLGQDRILDSGGLDNLHFASDIRPEQLILTRVNADLRIGFTGRDDSVSLLEWFRAPRNSIERFVFADGAEWSATDIAASFNSITGNGTVVGSVADDLLYGGAVADTLQGGAGNDLLDGGLGADSLRGGTGDDVYIANGSDTIVELAGEGIDTLVWTSNADVVLQDELENLVLAESTGYKATGNAANNRIIGNSQDNSLNGGIGADTLEGGLGSDAYYVDNPGDVVIERANEGNYDQVIASTSYTLTEQVESLTLTGSAAINGTGNELGNSLRKP